MITAEGQIARDCRYPLYVESRKVVNLPPDKNILEGKPSSQNNRKWAWIGCVIEASIVFHGPSSGQWPCDRNEFLTLITCNGKVKPVNFSFRGKISRRLYMNSFKLLRGVFCVIALQNHTNKGVMTKRSSFVLCCRLIYPRVACSRKLRPRSHGNAIVPFRFSPFRRA